MPLPECPDTAIRSHSQQRQGQLRSIACDGLVYALDRNLYRATKRQPSDSVPWAKIGIAEATVFRGYCGRHDSELFEIIEHRPLDPHDRAQALALFLRALSHEVAAKRRADAIMGRIRQDLGGPLHPRADEMAAGRRLFLEREAPYYLDRLFAYRANPTDAPVVFAGRTIPSNLGVSCTTAINPYLDDYARRSRLEVPQPIVAACMVPSETSSTIMLVALDEHAGLLCDFVRSLYDDERLEELLNCLLFTESEDTCVNPALWESLPEPTQQEALQAMRHDLFRGPVNTHPRVIRLSSKVRETEGA